MSCLAPLLVLALVQPGGPAIPVTAPAPAPPEGPASAPQPAPAVDHELPVRSERAAPAAEQRQLTWSRERRRLQLHTGLSGGFTGAMLLTGTLLLVLPDGCNNPNCELNFGRTITAITLLPLAVIPMSFTIYWGVRLGRHNRQRPTSVLRPGPGGFVLQF